MESAKFDLSGSNFTGHTAVGNQVRQTIGASVFSGQEITAHGALDVELACLLSDLRRRAGQSPALTMDGKQEVEGALTELAGELTRSPAERDQRRLTQLTTRMAALCQAAAPLIDLANHITNLISH